MRLEVLYSEAEKTVLLLKQNNLTLSTAESCTGGMVSSFITSVSGASEIFEMGVTSYSCRIKNKALKVKEKTLNKFGAVSKETALEMANGIRKISKSDIGISVTGVAGPSYSEGHPPGYVYIALDDKKTSYEKLLNIPYSNREDIRHKAVLAVFKMIQNHINNKGQI